MTISTLDQTRTTGTDAEGATQKQGSMLRAALGGFPLVLWSGFFRAVVLAADYLLAFVTAVVVVPSLGAWLHAQSGVSQSALTGAGTIAMWLMPFLFLVALLAAGEIAFMRGMWRWSTRMTERIRDARGEGNAATSMPTSRTNHRSRRNHKRSA